MGCKCKAALDLELQEAPAASAPPCRFWFCGRLFVQIRSAAARKAVILCYNLASSNELRAGTKWFGFAGYAKKIQEAGKISIR